MADMLTMAAIVTVGLCTVISQVDQVPEDFPRFVVPGYEGEMESLRALFWLHYEPAGPLIPLWDEWMPMSTLWPARGSGEALEEMRSRWASALTGRKMDAEGYIQTQQHDGPAHAGGWPFPRWMEAGGIGWHFRGTGVPGYDGPPASPDGWKVVGGQSGEINDQGWVVELVEPGAVLETPSFEIEAGNSPWLRLNWWAEGIDGASCYVEWTTVEQSEFHPASRAYFTAANPAGQLQTAPPMGPRSAGDLSESTVETRTMIPVYRIPEWKGTVTRLRIHIDNPANARLVIKSFHTACDTRHNINNSNFIRGCHDYFLWTRDVTFLRGQIGRMRSAMRFIMNEFDTRQRKCVYTTWRGHEGRSGVRRTPDGQKEIIRGEGIGSNYWDLLPFGGEDALATVYYYDALLDLADIEEQLGKHPQWCVAAGAESFDPGELRNHACEVKEYGSRRFWNAETGRFGTVDLGGTIHDYGFTFLNNEAVYYNFAEPEQARLIRDWISGRRLVEGDTSVGEDIYHWRFGPRSTTRRNIDYYFWAWSNPENIPWGFQVQDGGAVLGFSYHDLMSRLMTDGPDDAWGRLRGILKWFGETRAAGGYRAYYQDPVHGTMQGGNVAGGLGLDLEFFESILVPQVMLYGFLGFRPTVDGFAVNPSLPGDWPELTITRIHLHENVIDIKACTKMLTVTVTGKSKDPMVVGVPEDWDLVSFPTGVAVVKQTGEI